MTFNRLKDYSTSPGNCICRQARWSLLAATVFGAALVAIPLIVIPIMVLKCLIAAVVLIFPLVFGSAFLKSVGPQNWLMEIKERGITVKFRSFANSHFPLEDQVVVSFDRREIAWVGQKKEVLISSTSEGVCRETIRYLQIGLKEVNIEELSRRLLEEQNRKPPIRHGVSSETNDHPVRLVDGSTLQITWRSSSARIVPSLKKVLEQLSSIAPIREILATMLDTVKSPKDQAEMESRILELAQRGKTIEAIALARKRYGYSLSEAKDFVDGLSSSTSASSDQTV